MVASNNLIVLRFIDRGTSPPARSGRLHARGHQHYIPPAHWLSEIDGGINTFEIPIPSVDPAPGAERTESALAKAK
jgi:hypothetical protein